MATNERPFFRSCKSCPFLEKLCICRSVCLTSVRSCGLGHALKHLELHIQNACMLSELSLGVRDTASVVSAFDSPWKYFSQLELLHVKLYMERNSIAPAIPTLANVKHMILTICAHTGQSFIGWVGLIEASPVLHKLPLQITRFRDTQTTSTFWHADKVPRK
uniref:Uncharacterized protein n=1 Tax=Opuntia streptacantha TaxID=393608 RepID=A0A7C8Z4H8_OPUST